MLERLAKDHLPHSRVVSIPILVHVCTMKSIFCIIGLTFFAVSAKAQQGGVCSTITLCEWGCCSANGKSHNLELTEIDMSTGD
jgi:hypothetical protein